MVRLVFLHGIGDGQISGSWLAAADKGLNAVGYPCLDPNHVIAPRYASSKVMTALGRRPGRVLNA